MKKSPILGYYGYWVVLTYMAVISAMAGVCLSVTGHIDAAVVCMIFSGVCDMFDGTVARTATRTDSQKAFGIQIDSLADVISFGVLPATVGFGIFRQNYSHSTVGTLIVALIAGLYVLAALIRLTDEIDVAADRDSLMKYDTDVFVSDFQRLCHRMLESVPRLHVEPEAFIMDVRTDDDQVYHGLCEARDKMQQTLDLCRDVCLQRTPYRISQQHVNIRRL